MLGGAPRREDRQASPQRIPGPYGLLPAHLVDAAGSHAGDVVEQTAHEQAHEEGGRVPAARDQPSIDRSLGGFRIDMKRLRVEAAGEVEDLLLADRLLAELEDLAFVEVFQVSHRITSAVAALREKPDAIRTTR